MASRTAPLPEDNDEELTAGVQYSETSIPQVEGEVSEATHQDRVRKLLAQLLVGLLAVVVVLGFATMALSNLLHIKADDLKAIVTASPNSKDALSRWEQVHFVYP